MSEVARKRGRTSWSGAGDDVVGVLCTRIWEARREEGDVVVIMSLKIGGGYDSWPRH